MRGARDRKEKLFRDPPRCRRTGRSAESSEVTIERYYWKLKQKAGHLKNLFFVTFFFDHLIGIEKHRVSESKQKWCISNPSHQFKTFSLMHILGCRRTKNYFSGRIKRFSAEKKKSIGFHKNERQTFDLDPFWKLKSWWWSMRTDGWWFLPLNVSFGSITRTCIRRGKI